MSEGKVRLTHDVLDVGAVIAHVRHEGAGGLAVFVGTVRDHADGKPVTLLEYEAYAPMAMAEMQRCVDEIEHVYGVVRLAVHHRIGT
ncbi:MAG: molybdenum cofactor biosynthesis protein MoaE, partial [Polyangiales bacterium]